MIESLMAAALRNRVLILFAVALIVGLGAVALRTTPMDAFPDVTGVQVEVMCGAPGLSALEIERLVTYPIEIAMRGLPGLTAMRSVTKYGLSVITLLFRDDVDVFSPARSSSNVCSRRPTGFPRVRAPRWGPWPRPWARSTSTPSRRTCRPIPKTK